MRTLFHLPLSADCRAVRLALAEKGLPFALEAEPVWERRPDFLALNPAGEVPVLVEGAPGEGGAGAVVCGASVILEYLDEVHPEPPLIGTVQPARVEVRRLCDWFARAFAAEVGAPLLHEKLTKRFLQLGQPDSRAIRDARERLDHHLAYVDSLVDGRRWLAGETMTRSDLVAAAALSVVDYLGDVRWQAHEPARDWYAKLKSRPGFRPLLQDYVPGAAPPRHYADLDF